MRERLVSATSISLPARWRRIQAGPVLAKEELPVIFQIFFTLITWLLLNDRPCPRPWAMKPSSTWRPRIHGVRRQQVGFLRTYPQPAPP
jgi:hypothetical protein